jgi:hypothetical protein
MIPVYWHCPNGHILGVVECFNKKNTLRVYRQSLSIAPKTNTALASGEITGDAVIICSICSSRRKWTYQNDKITKKLYNKSEIN